MISIALPACLVTVIERTHDVGNACLTHFPAQLQVKKLLKEIDCLRGEAKFTLLICCCKNIFQISPRMPPTTALSNPHVELYEFPYDKVH